MPTVGAMPRDVLKNRTRLRFWFSGLLAIASCGPLLAAAQPRFELQSTQTVLPKSVLPQRVRLLLDVDPDRDDFGGHVSIDLSVRQAVASIVMHARQLRAGRARLLLGRAVRDMRVVADEASGTWRLTPVDGRPIAVGVHRLEIDYRGQIQASGEGLFRVEYRQQGAPARMLVTQLQAVDARRVLPAFDEPVFRTAFELSVRAPNGYDVVSNMPRRSVRADANAQRHDFAVTPSMPDYLLALAVGQFDVLEDRVDGLPLRILTPRGKRDQARFAMEVTKQVVPFFTRYFGHAYALPKLDQLAVPGTLVGAMENWGLITYVESALLFDSAQSGPNTQRDVFKTVAHEVAHQWFGNLVSVASWNEIWLNEAFATWMEQKARTHFHPEWQTALRVRRNLEPTMDRDSTEATRAIRSGPVSEASVFEVFDDVTYDKGGAVLTMLEQWVGAPAFQRGLASYMAERAMKPATAGDLWHHIGQAADQPVAQVAASWTDQAGIPLLELSSRCEKSQTVVSLRQSRFSLGEPLAGGPWLLPVRLAHGDKTLTFLMRGAEQRLELPGCNELPLRANAGGGGYYRVDYEPALRSRLVGAFATLPPGDRLALMSDSFALASAGRRPMADHLALVRALPQVHDASRSALFSKALSDWHLLDVALDGTDAQGPLRVAGYALFAPELDRLGWAPAPGEDSETLNYRSALISGLGTLAHPPTLAEARQRFALALKPGHAGLAPSIRDAVLLAVGTEPQEAEFDALMSAFRATESQEDRWALMNALAAGRDESRARQLLEESLSGRIPPDVSAFLPSKVGERPSLGPLAYEFVLANWSTLSRLAGNGVFGGQNWLLPGASYWSADTAVARQLLLDQQRLAGAAGASTAHQAATGIELRHQLREREAVRLAAALASWSPSR